MLGVHIDGGMADYVCVPEANIVAADGVTLDQAAMVEFLAIGAHAVRRGGVQRDNRVLVVGAGPIGIACMIFAKLRGAEVTALDAREDRLEFCAEQIAVDHCLRAGPEARSELSRLTGAEFFDCVFDATGSADAMNAGFDLVAHGGAYVLVSIVRETISFSDPEFHKRESTLLEQPQCDAARFRRGVRGVAQRAHPDRRAQHPSRAARAKPAKLFPEWIKPDSGVIKAIFEI